MDRHCGVAAICLLFSNLLFASNEKPQSSPTYFGDIVREHEIKQHRSTIPLAGVPSGSNQLRLRLTVSPAGDVVEATLDDGNDPRLLKFWGQVQDEVRRWRFTPFQRDGRAVTALVEECVDLIPAERMPKVHIHAPDVNANSRVTILLRRGGCLGSCPSYSVSVATDKIVFEGYGFVVAGGKHTARANEEAVRELARRFVAADFYSMDTEYTASATDLPTYVLSITIDGNTKKVEDYEGPWVGMPAVIRDLEDAVDTLAQTQRWIEGEEGLVKALQAEKFGFKTYAAQLMLKEAASRGKTVTVREFLNAGVPLTPLPVPEGKEFYFGIQFKFVGWLSAASNYPQTLKVFLDAGASKKNQKDKNLALANAAGAGNLESVRALIAYGADPKADFRRLIVTERSAGLGTSEKGAGSVLIYAAKSGKPEVIREILRYHPKLEMRDREGKTALFAAGEYRDSDEDGARVECVRLLLKAGADVNARDNDGNTPLHETFLTDVEEELLKHGADVNARNKDGETPIFTTVDNEAIPLFIKYGADLKIRNRQGLTVFEAAKDKGPLRQQALRNAMGKISTS